MKEIFREIPIESIEGFRIGNAQDAVGGSGCTVIICEGGAVGGVDVRGGGPASRETDLLESAEGLPGSVRRASFGRKCFRAGCCRRSDEISGGEGSGI